MQLTAQRPARMSLVNMATGEALEAQFHPTELEEGLEMNWARHTVPGLSHQPLQFVNTGNVKFALELFFVAEGPADLEQLHHARRYLYSLCVPRRAEHVAAGGPPRVLFVWPNVVSLTCVATGLSFKHSRFNRQGTPVELTAKVSLEEVRDVRLSADEVLAHGTRRSGFAPGGE